jgi:hypothetical protein
MKGKKGFERGSDSMRFGVRLDSNFISELRNKDININSVIKKGLDKWDGISEFNSKSVSIFGRFETEDQKEKYLKLKNKRAFIEKILLERLLEK